ncbi:hypothetical protein EGW08_023536 [Elysia chlorotica]|uniref:Acyl-ACP thioesterase-like C-terminal domain-containing protein n=1 Tax=Elysia chlorotica TaxID=188477 RepID=A0A3S0Z7I3_ELYCH|nr:hypothetical protein EGW08_023536 [Elysia chlorotica]
MASPTPTTRTAKTSKAPMESMHVTNFRYTASPHPTVECTVPGLSHESYDKDWIPRTSSLMWVDALTRYYVLHRPLDDQTEPSKQGDGVGSSSGISSQVAGLSLQTETGSAGQKLWSYEDTTRAFLNWGQFLKNAHSFGQYSELTMTKALYDREVSKWTLDLRFRLGFVGACSVTKICEYFARGKDGKNVLIWSNKYQQVAVDKKTRQPTRVPTWFKDKYQGKGCLSQAMVLRPFKKPEVTFCHPILVQYSDIDEYGHANWSAYIKWTTDAIHAAMLPDKQNGNGSCQTKGGRVLRSITKETLGRGLHKFQVTYFRECLEGDHVEVHLWEDGQPNQVLCCLVKSGEEICQIKLFYFDDDESL